MHNDIFANRHGILHHDTLNMDMKSPHLIYNNSSANMLSNQSLYKDDSSRTVPYNTSGVVGGIGKSIMKSSNSIRNLKLKMMRYIFISLEGLLMKK